MGLYQRKNYSKVEVVLQSVTTETKYYINDLILGEIEIKRSRNEASVLTCEIFRGSVIDVEGNRVASFWPGLGDSISVQLDGAGVFFGWIRDIQYDAGEKTVTITAYDQIYFLAKNSDVANYGTITAGNLLRRIINDFANIGDGLRSTGYITATHYLIPDVIIDGGSLLDCVLDAMDKTYAATGERYFLIDDYSNIKLLNSEYLARWTSPVFQITKDSVLGKVTVDRSIVETKTKYKVVQNNEQTGERITWEYWNNSWIDRYGLTQGYYECGTDENPEEICRNLFYENCRVHFTLSVTDVAGQNDVWGGSPVYVDLTGKEGIRGWFRTDSVTMHIGDGSFLMDMELELDYLE